MNMIQKYLEFINLRDQQTEFYGEVTVNIV